MSNTINKSASPVLDIYKPAKVLQCTVTSSTGEKTWPFDDGENDPWWSGSSSPKFYQYSITFTVTAYTHGSHKTRDPRKYNGLDVAVGDWIAGSQDGKCMQIISVTAKTETEVTCVVEDVLRYNTFRSATGSPLFSVPGTAIVFTVNEMGKPLLDPLPASVVSTDFFPNITSRFEYFNPSENFRLQKTNHGFQRGDVIVCTELGEFDKANASTVARTIGVVSVTGPGPDQFMLMPQNRIIDFNPAIPGTAGDYIYADTDGDLTTSYATNKVLFLKIKDSIPTTLISGNSSAQSNVNSVLEINDVNVTLSGGNISTVVSDITAANTNVAASVVLDVAKVTSNSSDYLYGLVGGFIPFSASIDSGSGNTTINFNSDTSGSVAYGAGIADGKDIIDAINNSGIPNLSALVLGSGEIELTEDNGNAVSIYNINNDTNGTPFAGSGSISGLATSTGSSTLELMKLVRADGGPIDLRNRVGTPTTDLEIYSVHNGQFPLALYIEHGVKTGGIVVVNSIASRDNLSSQGGDMAYVTDAGGGEWGLFIFDGSGWVEVGNQDSAATDAQTLTTTYTTPGGGLNGIETINLGNISPGCRIVEIVVEVITPIGSYTGQPPVVEVGVTNDIDQFMTGDESDLEEAATYSASPNYLYPETQTTDLQIKARITHRNALQGEFTVSVTYV